MRNLITALVLLIGGGFGITTTVMGNEDAKQTPPAKLMDTVKQMVESLSKATMAKGKISMIEPADHRFALTTEEKELFVTMEESTPIKLNDKAAKPEELRTGDEAIVLYDVKDGKNVARAIVCVRTGSS
jgi:hypothetical protein